MPEDITVDGKNCAGREQDQPCLRRGAEIAAEGLPEVPENASFFVIHHVKGDVEEGSGSRTGCDDRKAEDKPEKVQENRVRYLCDQAHDPVIGIQEIMHGFGGPPFLLQILIRYPSALASLCFRNMICSFSVLFRYFYYNSVLQLCQM